MNLKDLHFEEEARLKLFQGIHSIYAAVSSTLGPGGNTVLIESEKHLHGITVTKDGVTVARDVELHDPVENLGVRMMRQASEKTAVEAGDGTTTSIVLAFGMLKRMFDEISDEGLNKSVNKTKLIREVNALRDQVVSMIGKKAKPMTPEMIHNVATLSSNNDEVIGRMIAEVYELIGKDGVLTVEKSKTSQTYYEATQGFVIDRGYSNPLFVNDHKRDECVLEDVKVLLYDGEIHSILQIENVLKEVIAKNQKLLIVSQCSNTVVNTLAANVHKGTIKACVIQPPNFGYKQHELMQDIALSTGATYFSEKTGDDLSLITHSDLGVLSKCVVNDTKTIAILSDEIDIHAIDKRIGELREAAEEADQVADKDFIRQRIASLSGGVGVIHVGGKTDLEQKELYDRVDDAICAVRSALEEGVMPGGGNAFISFVKQLKRPSEDSPVEKKLAYNIMVMGLSYPVNQIMVNSGIDPGEIYPNASSVQFGKGYNVATGKSGNLINMGVIDPAKVTRCAFENAVSVVTTILSTNAVITMSRQLGS